MTTDEQHTLGVHIVVICLLALMVGLKMLQTHPEWFGN